MLHENDTEQTMASSMKDYSRGRIEYTKKNVRSPWENVPFGKIYA
jgi:hypothetical protein